jgi:glutaconate CoA-transferase subunit A
LWAAKRVIVSVEEIVPTEVVRRDPNRTLVPGARVSAVVHEPWGAHPTSVPGYYDYDYPFLAATGGAYRSRESWQAHADEWIYGVEDRAGYLAHLRERFGDDWLENVRPTEPIRPIAEIDYGFASELKWPGR